MVKKLLVILTLFVVTNALVAKVYYEARSYEPIGHCCYGNTISEDNMVRWDNDFKSEWPHYGVTNQDRVGFVDRSEQSLISGFERGVYNTPK